jgi:hypothetical protein
MIMLEFQYENDNTESGINDNSEIK